MKELTIEEKAKRYDEALEKGKQIQNTPYTAHWDIMKEVVEHLLPEPKESEDERIRKNIISWLKNIEGQTIPIDDYNSAIAWLEKQGNRDEKDYGKELKKCKANPLYFFDKYVKVKLKEQKPPFSEEVEKAIQLLKDIADEEEEDYCPHNANNLRKAAQYLETCRPQNQWKPSGEQMKALEDAIEFLGCTKKVRNDLKSLYEQLKKLREG